jgi:ParB family transcriptional regulator, chromosome partitioning protein
LRLYTKAYSISNRQRAWSSRYQHGVAEFFVLKSQNMEATPSPSSRYFNNSIFWVETERIVPNPYQPRREFDPHALKDLSESIRMYGLLQPLVVTRNEIIKEDEGLAVEYELISGERRLRASKLAGLAQVPVIIRAGHEDARVKLELAIIENLQREDLNAVDRARSFQRLSDEFGLKHVQIAEKVGKSREYVSNSIRLLALPEHMLQALSEKKISEGHTRPLLMLTDRPEEREVLFKEIVFRKITVREAEAIARRVAVDRVRKKDASVMDPEMREFENKLNAALGTRVLIEKRENGGKVVIDFFSNDDLRHILKLLETEKGEVLPFEVSSQLQSLTASVPVESVVPVEKEVGIGVNEVFFTPTQPVVETVEGVIATSDLNQDSEVVLSPIESRNAEIDSETTSVIQTPTDDSTPSDQVDDQEMYSIKNFSI